ncbi:hypothetical protein BKA83DRAFT_1774743 [Pisolithus microcarpus]|nr:hypothetical protein BKA83DRAFT_1774743 [Pisolithus microcarpus]
MHRWSLPISNLIDDFFDSAFHVRLSLFSYESLDKLQNQPLAVQTVKVHHKDQSVYILDVSQFPLETGMRPLDWHSAWECFLEWIGRRQGLIQRRMWACHFRFLARKDHFVDNFPAILRFDIKVRSFLHSQPRFFDVFQTIQVTLPSALDLSPSFSCHSRPII